MRTTYNKTQAWKSWSDLVKGDEEELYPHCRDGAEEPGVDRDHECKCVVSDTTGQDVLSNVLQHQRNRWNTRAACDQNILDLTLYGATFILACVTLVIVWCLLSMISSSSMNRGGFYKSIKLRMLQCIYFEIQGRKLSPRTANVSTKIPVLLCCNLCLVSRLARVIRRS